MSRFRSFSSPSSAITVREATTYDKLLLGRPEQQAGQRHPSTTVDRQAVSTDGGEDIEHYPGGFTSHCDRYHTTRAGYCSDRVTVETDIGAGQVYIRPRPGLDVEDYEIVGAGTRKVLACDGCNDLHLDSQQKSGTEVARRLPPVERWGVTRW